MRNYSVYTCTQIISSTHAALQVLNTNSTEPGVVANTVQNNSITLPFQIINASEPGTIQASRHIQTCIHT